MPPSVEPARRGFPVAACVAAAWVVALSALVILGADLMWVVALGDAVRADGAVPASVPFATAPQTDWPNPVVVAEVVLSLVHAAGWWGLPALQLLLVGATLAVLVRDARAGGAREGRTALALSLVVVGAAATLVVTRFPSLSLVPFVLLVALLRAQQRRPGRAVWLVPPLVLVWGNLHGAVLVGVAVLGVWVVASGGQRLVTRGLVGLVSLVSLLVTSAGVRTPEYYVAALQNEAAARGTDLWAAPDPTHPFDVAMIACAVVLLALAARSLRVWEWLVVAGLVAATADAARHGVWLLLFLAPVAAVARARTATADEATPGPSALRRAVTAGAVVLAALASAALLAARSDAVRPPGEGMVTTVRDLARGRPVLAVEPAAETLAAGGVTVWASNPIDAFTRRTQSDYLDFLHDCRVPDPALEVALVDDECATALAAQGWTVASRGDDLVAMVRGDGAGPTGP